MSDDLAARLTALETECAGLRRRINQLEALIDGAADFIGQLTGRVTELRQTVRSTAHRVGDRWEVPASMHHPLGKTYTLIAPLGSAAVSEYGRVCNWRVRWDSGAFAIYPAEGIGTSGETYLGNFPLSPSTGE